MEPSSRPARPLIIAVVLAALALSLGVAEVGLRAAGFSSQILPTLQFGWPIAKVLVNQYHPDHDLFWVPNDYSGRLAAARIDHPAVVFMGDSCTEFGEYPALTLEHLKRTQPDLASGIKLGVAGWSSVQGLAQLQRDVLPLNPRVVTIYFGWNDHWRALGPADEDARLTSTGFWLSQHARVYQLWMKAQLVMGPKDLAKRPIRVPLERYEGNLRTMARMTREHGAKPVLITAPEGHEAGKEPQYLTQQHVARLADLIPLHVSYIEATRRAARESGAVLCDAAEAFEELPAPKAQYFQKDGIHLSPEGDARLARIVASCVAGSGAFNSN